MSFITLNMRSASELEASCTEMLSRSCVLSCMKVTRSLCTELSNMCEVDAVAPSRRSFIYEAGCFRNNRRMVVLGIQINEQNGKIVLVSLRKSV